MKKIKLISIITIMTLSMGLLQGCENSKTNKEAQSGSKNETQVEEVKEEDCSQVINYEGQEKKTNKDIPIRKDELELIEPYFEIDCIGTCYFKAKVKNNSKYDIDSLCFTYNVDDESTSYLWVLDGLAKGNTSPTVECFGSYTQSLDNMKLTEIQATYLDENNIKHYVSYNANLDKYYMED